MTNGIQNLLPKFGVDWTKIERAADNLLFLKLLAELAMIFTSYVMTNGNPAWDHQHKDGLEKSEKMMYHTWVTKSWPLLGTLAFDCI